MYWTIYMLIKDYLAGIFDRQPIIVYTMRKSGSTTLTKTLRQNGLKIYKQHCLNNSTYNELVKNLTLAGFPEQHWLFDGQSFQHRLSVYKKKARISRDFRCKIISVVRDPLAVAYSDLFMQVFELMPGAHEKLGVRNGKDFNELFFQLINVENDREEEPLMKYLRMIIQFGKDWFTNELQYTTGINAFDYSFDSNKGYMEYKSDFADILLIRAEDINKCGLQAMNSFLSMQMMDLVHSNITKKKAFGEIYVEAKNSIRLSEDDVKNIYNNSYAHHFYSASEVSNMIKKWI